MKKQYNFPAAIALIGLLFFLITRSQAGVPSAITTKDSSLPRGTIAFTRNGTEIRLIDSNGKNERLLWTDQQIKPELGIMDLAWSPDGKELAFSSEHEALFSLYHADIYGIRPDGTGLRKITNSPSHKELSKYRKGSVMVTVRNNQYTFQKAQSSAGVFFVNIIGAGQPQMVTIPPGSSKTIVFKSVADYGDHAQPLVAINGNYRWFMPGTDVQAGKNIKAPDLIISGDGMEYFGAFRPVWKQDGSQISYRDGVCLVKTVNAHPSPGVLQFGPMFEGKNPMGTCTWDCGPTPALKDYVIYTENSGDEGSGIFLMKQGTTHNVSSRLTIFADIQYQLLHDLKWLPDGSGFLYSTVNLYRDASNIFYFDIKSKQTRQVTNLQAAFARKFTISPGSSWVVYERSTSADEDAQTDLWMIRIDGTGDHLLVKNGASPSWSR